MTRFIHLTDLHVSHPDAGDPSANVPQNAPMLEQVVGLINAMERQPDFVVASGDLTNMGDPDSYAMLKDILKPLAPPLVMALGNHDKREGFHKVFEGTSSDAPFFNDQVLGGLHVITLDTLVPGHVAGTLCDAQFDYLAAALSRHADLPKLIVMHHPPRVDADGLPWGSIDMDSTNRLADLLRGQHIAGILSGHIHINQVNHWNGIPLVVSMGLNSSVDLLETNDLRLVEGRGFGVCDWRATGLSVSFVPLTPTPRELGVIDRARLLAFT
ncbi:MULTISPECIES: metallophosphoesterase family protein [Roseobacteraceae]|uniref:3',5'-cyclic adenosine monophosphate phosphodiesterase CpdA n=1 Tax=Pseudosulfitobacter pseudonitzschiae TaxID=1402135 RepID=A0A221K6B4_9RHOB|nr:MULTISPECIES: metallophosphoesterase [Roseobacteraceae]ASM74538.1 3',5'-cyclic adenosine monophosphate phosphodiesterase CpdA [Pseudosulfitobacter pseudonitzschiae]